jgi:hypothetical protein
MEKMSALAQKALDKVPKIFRYRQAGPSKPVSWTKLNPMEGSSKVKGFGGLDIPVISSM